MVLWRNIKVKTDFNVLWVFCLLKENVFTNKSVANDSPHIYFQIEMYVFFLFSFYFPFSLIRESDN
jgi:hypothetical protein